MLTMTTTSVGIFMYKCGLCPACLGKRLIVWRQQAATKVAQMKTSHLILMCLVSLSFFIYVITMYPQIFYFARYRVVHRFGHSTITRPSARLRHNVTFSDVCGVDCVPDVDSMMTSGYDIPYEPLGVTAESFTILTMATHQDDVIRQFLGHYSKMRRVQKIVLFWPKSRGIPPSYEKELSMEVPLIIRMVNKTSLLTQFSALKDIRTDGVLLLDDDIILGRDELYLAYHLWKTHPWGIVGFYGGRHRPRGSGRFTHSYVPYDYYSMIQTGALFLHKEYLRLYVDRFSAGGIKEACDVIALNFLVSNHCRCSAAFHVMPRSLYIRVTHKFELLSTKWQFNKDNNICLNYVANIFGSMPLKMKSCFW